jgi:hypothetical protein
MSNIENGRRSVEMPVVKNGDRFKRFLANNRAVLPSNWDGLVDMRTTRELMAERVAVLKAEQTANA